MSHRINICGIRINDLAALRAAVNALGGELSYKISENKNYLSGHISLKDDRCFAHISLQYQGSSPVVINENELIQSGFVTLSYDSDYRTGIERAFGIDGARITERYAMNVAVNVYRQKYGDAASFNVFEQNGVPIMDITITTTDESIANELMMLS